MSRLKLLASPRTFAAPYSRRDMLGMSLASVLGVSFSGWLPRLAGMSRAVPQVQSSGSARSR